MGATNRGICAILCISATEAATAKINAQYAAAVQAIAEKDLKISRLIEENKRLAASYELDTLWR